MASAVSSHKPYESHFKNMHKLLGIKVNNIDIQTNCNIEKGSNSSSSSSSKTSSSSSKTRSSSKTSSSSSKTRSSGIKGSLSGGNGTMINLNDFKCFTFLTHGRFEMNKTTALTPEIHPTIDVNSFPNVENLAVLCIAPAGIVNVGNELELSTYSNLIDKELKRVFEEQIIKQQFTPQIQGIEDKANEVMGVKKQKLSTISSVLPTSREPPPSYAPPAQPVSSSSRQSFFSRICNFCFSIIPTRDIIDSFVGSIRSGEIDGGYIFKGFFNICKTILPSMPLDGGAPPKRKRPKKNTPLCSISSDMFIMLLNELRKYIKDFDSDRFEIICQMLEESTPTYDLTSVRSNKQNRCRKVSLLKGFGSTELLPYANKYLVYNTLADEIMNMGVSVLSFKVNRSGKVKCVIEDIDAKELMENITHPSKKIVNPSNPLDITYWSTMQDCISYCTVNGGPNQTCFFVDLSCSSCCFISHRPIDSVHIGLPGGNKTSKTRKMKNKSKNKSKNIKYIRNKRKYKNKTKRLGK
jgi:hypothetical protein